MPFFFTASGFFLAIRALDDGWYAKALKKRFKSLVLPFWIWGTILSLFYAVLRVLRDSPGDRGGELYAIAKAVKQIDLLEIAGISSDAVRPLWFVQVLIVLVIVSPLILWILRRFKHFALFAVFALYLAYGSGARAGANGWLTGLCFFSIGMVAANDLRMLRISLKPALLLGLAGVSIGFARMIIEWRGCAGSDILRQFAIPLVMAFLWSLVPLKRFPQILAGASFAIYMIHIPFIGIWRGFEKFTFGTFGEDSIIAILVVWIFASVSSILAAALLHKCLPRVSNLIFGGR